MKTLEDLKSITKERIEEEAENNGYASAVEEITIELRELGIEWIKTINSEEIIEKDCPACKELGNRFIWKKNGCPIIFTKSEGFEIIEVLKELFDLSESDL